MSGSVGTLGVDDLAESGRNGVEIVVVDGLRHLGRRHRDQARQSRNGEASPDQKFSFAATAWNCSHEPGVEPGAGTPPDLGNGGIAAGVGVENIRDLRQQRNPGE